MKANKRKSTIALAVFVVADALVIMISQDYYVGLSAAFIGVVLFSDRSDKRNSALMTALGILLIIYGINDYRKYENSFWNGENIHYSRITEQAKRTSLIADAFFTFIVAVSLIPIKKKALKEEAFKRPYFE